MKAILNKIVFKHPSIVKLLIFKVVGRLNSLNKSRVCKVCHSCAVKSCKAKETEFDLCVIKIKQSGVIALTTVKWRSTTEINNLMTRKMKKKNSQ